MLKVTRLCSTSQRSLLRSNLDVARAVLSALKHPKQRNLGDRELGRRLGLDHRTIGRWRKRLAGGEVLHLPLTKKQFLSACSRVSRILPDPMWGELEARDMACVRQAYNTVHQAYIALHRVLYGERTLPDTPAAATQKEETCK